VLAGVIAGLLGIVVVGLVTRRIALPVTRLTQQTMDIAAGQRTLKPSRSRVRELDQLGMAISTLSDDLNSKLYESERASAALDVVLGALPQGTILIGADDRVGYANRAAETLIGPIPETLHALSPFALQSAATECRDSADPVARDFDHGRPVRRLRVEATPFSGERQVLLIVTDITDTERTAAIRRDFVANASHELKTPIASIIASAEALRIAAAHDPTSAVRFADQVEASSRQLNDLVSDLLDLSHLEREEPEMIPLDLGQVVREQVERIRSRAESAGVTLEVAADAVQVLGNSEALATALRNILDNALRHTDGGDVIRASVTSEGGFAVVAIADTGEGIPIREQERIFERFYRVDAARSRTTGGTGLGLSIVKHAVEGHGGHVEVDSELGVGSTFRLVLPQFERQSDGSELT
jgi:signal transduction histidine kinase